MGRPMLEALNYCYKRNVLTERSVRDNENIAQPFPQYSINRNTYIYQIRMKKGNFRVLN